jgi:hypothetical protein
MQIHFTVLGRYATQIGASQTSIIGKTEYLFPKYTPTIKMLHVISKSKAM